MQASDGIFPLRFQQCPLPFPHQSYDGFDILSNHGKMSYCPCSCEDEIYNAFENIDNYYPNISTVSSYITTQYTENTAKEHSTDSDPSVFPIDLSYVDSNFNFVTMNSLTE